MAAKAVSQERLRELLDYDPATGVFTWRARRCRSALKGQVAGSVSQADHHSGGGYRHIGIDGRDYYAHRLAFLYMSGRWPRGQLDHRNQNRDDNRWSNLRDATISENRANTSIRADSSSGFKGVSETGSGKWMAQIMRRGSYRYLGSFDTPEKAHEAYTSAAEELFGEFHRAN